MPSMMKGLMLVGLIANIRNTFLPTGAARKTFIFLTRRGTSKARLGNAACDKPETICKTSGRKPF